MRIRNWENQLITWIQSHILLLAFFATSILGFVIRISLRSLLSGDADFYLLPWYETIRSNGGLQALDTQVGNYNFLYQFLISLMTYLPIPPLYSYKILSCIFDYLLALSAAHLVKCLTPGQNSSISALITYTLVLLSPPVFLNSAAWAQCDSIYVFWAICAFYFLCIDRYHLSILCLGISLAFKLQAVFLVPFFLLAWFMKKDMSILNFLWIPVAMLVTALPAIFMGRDPMDLIYIYLQQTEENYILHINYPSFLALFTPAYYASYAAVRDMAIFFTMAALLSWACICIYKKVVPTPINLLYLFFILCYTCVFFLPSMHERYGYAYEIAAIIIAVLDRRTWYLLAALLVITLASYSNFLFGYSFTSFGILAVANGFIYLSYSRHILWQICSAENAVLVDCSLESA